MRESCHFPCRLKAEGAANGGRWMRPQSRVQNEKAHEHGHHGHTGFARHSLRNGFNGFLRALLGDRALLPPSRADLRPPTWRQRRGVRTTRLYFGIRWNTAKLKKWSEISASWLA